MKRIKPEEVEQTFVCTPQITFEMTESCNLRCKYCGYGELYNASLGRGNGMLQPKRVFSFLDFFLSKIEKSKYSHLGRGLYISFYGGEPLLNFSLINEIVEWVNSHGLRNYRDVKFSMTTNGVLLHHYMDFIVQHEFELLISLDGDEQSSLNRVFPDGRCSFSVVKKNVDILCEKYPNYFASHVKFNSVLHTKSSVESLYNFFQKEYGKFPTISDMNNFGVIPEKQEDFSKMSLSVVDSIDSSKMRQDIIKKMGVNSPFFMSTFFYLRSHSPELYENYNELLFGKTPVDRLFPSGTCLPFGKRVFMSVEGLLLPCERVPHSSSLAVVKCNGEVVIDFKSIADRYNYFYEQLESRCSGCSKIGGCSRCFWQMQLLISMIL